MSALFIIAACSRRKRLPVPPRRCLRAITGRSINLRATAWRSVLHESTERGVAAGDLYAGEYWSVIRGLSTLAERAGFCPEFFVASAGYGLVPANRPVLGYSATFTAGHPDSVLRSGDDGLSLSEARSQWWQHINGQNGQVATTALPITTLATQDVHADYSGHCVSTVPGCDVGGPSRRGEVSDQP